MAHQGEQDSLGVGGVEDPDWDPYLGGGVPAGDGGDGQGVGIAGAGAGIAGAEAGIACAGRRCSSPCRHTRIISRYYTNDNHT